MMTIQEIDKILSTCHRKLDRQREAVAQTEREITAWRNLRTAKENETKK